MTENVSKMCFIVNFKIPKRHPYFLWARDCSYASAQVMAKYVISMAAILNVS